MSINPLESPLQETLKISRILHAGYIFQCGETQIAFDPIFENPFSRNCHAFPPVSFDTQKISQLNLAAVFISHYHDDHCSLESLDLLDRKTPIYLYCQFEELFDWIRALGFLNVHSLKLNESLKVGPFEVIPRRALDEDVDSLFHIKAAGLNILNVVDSWIDETTIELLSQTSPWDLVLWPFQTMRELEVLSPSRASRAPGDLPAEWISQLKMLKPRFVVPSSCQFLMENWSWYNHSFFPISYQQFCLEVSQALPETRLIRLDPSVSISIDSKSLVFAEPLSWIHPQGNASVDYDYKPELTAPSTAEIALHFPALEPTQLDKVLRFCREDLPRKFQSLEISDDPFFHQTRVWRLSLYDHMGMPIHFYYQIQGTELQAISEPVRPLAWTTEVPIGKLFSALEEGEALTSMYIRINDGRFDPQVEVDLLEVDVLQDPLIRCLFTGVFGAYQKAQLEKWLSKRSSNQSV